MKKQDKVFFNRLKPDWTFMKQRCNDLQNRLRDLSEFTSKLTEH